MGVYGSVLKILHSRFLPLDYCLSGELRLVDGESDDEGRVEVCLDNVWTSANNNNWNYLQTNVVCSELGYYPGQ